MAPKVLTSTNGEWYFRGSHYPDDALLKRFEELVAASRSARERAYAPYSQFQVGAAVLMGGELFTGSNVENASYGATICAERNAIFQGVQNGQRKLEVVAISTDAPAGSAPESRAPCGMCRQVISEFATSDTLVLLDRGEIGEGSPAGDVIRISSLFPLAFRLEKNSADSDSSR